MKRKLLIPVFLIIIISVITGCNGEEEIPNKLDWKIQDFEATDQDGEKITLGDLQGKVWLADFVFTSCTTVCPPMTGNMVKLQQKLEAENISIQIVSFSVDPERDTAEERKNYITERGGDLTNWSFLGGYTFDYVKDISESSFKAAAAKPPEGEDQFLHVTSFYLVDQEGTVVKKYNGFEEVPYDTIVDHAKILNSKGE